MKQLVSVVLAACWVQEVNACDLCSVYAATEAQAGAGRGFFAGVAEQFTYFGTLQLDGHKVARDGGQYLSSSTSQLFAGYNVNDRCGVQFNLPVIYREYGYKSTQGSEGGLGDVSLIANVRLYEKSKIDYSFAWTSVGGVKFPTGSASHLNPNEDDFAPGIGGHDLTLGSGSYDGIVGTGFHVRWKRAFMTGTAQYTIRTEGDFGYQFANDWMWIGGPGYYLILADQHTFGVQAVVSGESKGQDTIHGVATDDTAITAVYVGPQLNFTWSNRLSVQAGADFPAAVNASGLQLAPDYRVRAALTWRF